MFLLVSGIIVRLCAGDISVVALFEVLYFVKNRVLKRFCFGVCSRFILFSFLIDS